MAIVSIVAIVINMAYSKRLGIFVTIVTIATIGYYSYNRNGVV